MGYVNKREHFRVEIGGPIKWYLLNTDEEEILKNGSGIKLLKDQGLPSPIDEILEQVSPGSKEEQMYRSFQALNSKLDFIIENLLSGSNDSRSNTDELMEISASGIKFSTKKLPDIGAFLKMTLVLPGSVQYQIHLIAQVMRVESGHDSNIIATRIELIDEAARDSIIKTVFQKQRMVIRKLKADKGDNKID